ncbi:DNA-binding protein [Xanthomonas citri]|uniref:DNA-binding protein n=1 Tax=Xanthomonas citri TaxID=346 RepID=UPI000CCEFE3E|nr:DNA-binding protein [Xanthomonas citri]PNV26665.1 DNA-binding protein [Xanthomonas citri]
MTPVTVDTLPIDPTLPPHFDETPNDQRSVEQLDMWWDRPYAVSTPTGAFTVRCLHGGAWDRSSTLGTAPTIESAVKLANDELAQWMAIRSRPVLHVDASGRNDLVRPASRPDRDHEVILADCTTSEAAAWIDENEPH